MDFKKKSGIREMMEKNHTKWHFRSKRRGREEYVYTQKNSLLSENWVNEVFSKQERRYIVATDVEKKDGYTMRMPTRYNNFNLYSISAYEHPYEERDYPAECSYHVWMQEIASTQNGFTITESTDAALLSYEGDDSEVIIPDGVKIIDGAFEGCSGLTSVTIPGSVTTIGDRAFYGCSGLTSVTIPDSVTTIGEYAFDDCSGLKSITIPDSVTNIGNFAFSGCKSLENVYITDISKWCAIKFENTVSNPILYAEKFYLNNKLVTNLIIPDGVKSIRGCAFAGCSSLTSVTIPDSVDFIGGEAFEGCSGLTSITIPDSVTHIGWQAFEGCSGLTSIIIPDSVTSIGNQAFYGCTGLKSVTIPDSITSINLGVFSKCSGLTNITIPDSVTSIGEFAFFKCSGLTSVTIPDSVKSIDHGAFYGCSGLKSVTIPDSITSIGKEAFEKCDLREINTNSHTIKANISAGMSYLKYR